MTLNITFFILGSLLLVLQTTLFQCMPEWVGNPDLLFILIVYIATHMRMTNGGTLVFLFGMLTDIFAGIYLGVFPIIYLVLFVILKGASVNLFINDTSHPPPLVATCYLFSCSGVFLFSSMLATNAEINWSWKQVLLQTLILAVLAMPFFRFFNWITTHTKEKKKGLFATGSSRNQFRT